MKAEMEEIEMQEEEVETEVEVKVWWGVEIDGRYRWRRRR